DYAATRADRVTRPPTYPLRGGVGGAVGGTKCLHAHLAHHLAGGDNPIGREVSAEILPLDCRSACVAASPELARDPAWVEPRGGPVRTSARKVATDDRDDDEGNDLSQRGGVALHAAQLGAARPRA